MVKHLPFANEVVVGADGLMKTLKRIVARPTPEEATSLVSEEICQILQDGNPTRNKVQILFFIAVTVDATSYNTR